MLEYFNNWNAGIIQRIKGYFCNDMRYINLRFTYLLTYLFKCNTLCPSKKFLLNYSYLFWGYFLLGHSEK